MIKSNSVFLGLPSDAGNIFFLPVATGLSLRTPDHLHSPFFVRTSPIWKEAFERCVWFVLLTYIDILIAIYWLFNLLLSCPILTGMGDASSNAIQKKLERNIG